MKAVSIGLPRGYCEWNFIDECESIIREETKQVGSRGLLWEGDGSIADGAAWRSL
jgi:hypothetical protein